MDKLVFNPVTINDVDEIRHYIYSDKSQCSDYSCGIIFMWKDYLGLEFCIADDVLFLKANIKDKERFYMPCGDGDFHGAILKIIDYCKDKNIISEFMSLSEQHVLEFKKYFRVETKENRDYSDYIYDAQALAGLKGRKYHKKRNHISAFKKKYPDYVFEIINQDNIEDIFSFFEEFSSKYPPKDASERIERNCALYGLKNMKKLGFFGAVLKVEGNIIAFTYGEIKNDMAIIHVEKADREFDGAYTVINNEFANYCLEKYNVSLINREDDSGEEGLRKAKLSYYPSHLVIKYGLKIL